MLTNVEKNPISLTDAPSVPGLSFRPFQSPADLPAMLDVMNRSLEVDDIDEAETLESLTNILYEHPVNFDPSQDVLLAQVDGAIIGYVWVYWRDVANGGRTYSHTAFLLPEWRGKGIERAFLHYAERRLREIAPTLLERQTNWFEAHAGQAQTAKIHLLESAGYTPARYFLDMVRPDLDNIPDCPLPPGLEVRPARPEHYRAIYKAAMEAFRDHWSSIQRTEADYQQWLNDDVFFQPEIWKVAWDIASNQVAGMVLGFILEAQNAKFNRRRGYTEDICVRRPWRRRGIAHALIAENLRELKARGMTEAALGVDADNVSGALQLYTSMGFRPVKRTTVYRKPLR